MGRFHILAKTNHAVPTTYNDTLSSRPILQRTTTGSETNDNETDRRSSPASLLPRGCGDEVSLAEHDPGDSQDEGQTSNPVIRVNSCAFVSCLLFPEKKSEFFGIRLSSALRPVL
jgi:hypothetical protein